MQSSRQRCESLLRLNLSQCDGLPSKSGSAVHVQTHKNEAPLTTEVISTEHAEVMLCARGTRLSRTERADAYPVLAHTCNTSLLVAGF